MNDQPQVDNPQDAKLGLPIEKGENPFPLDSKQPGPETRSTALDLKNLSEQQKATDDPLIKALMQGMKKEKSPLPPIENQPEKKIEAKKNITDRQGFLMPFVNGFNGLIEGIWNALKSLIPMKPQTGT